jgi:hypothetical protein
MDAERSQRPRKRTLLQGFRAIRDPRERVRYGG